MGRGMGRARPVFPEGYKFPGTKLTYVRDADNIRGKRAVLCRCDCGNEWIGQANNVKTGKTISCGCMRRGKGGLLFKAQDVKSSASGTKTAVDKQDQAPARHPVWPGSMRGWGPITRFLPWEREGWREW